MTLGAEKPVSAHTNATDDDNHDNNPPTLMLAHATIVIN